jgi:hypothetical protein
MDELMNKFRAWYLRNQDAITWFLIGWLTLAGIYDFGRGEYVGALVLWSIAIVNYLFVKKN